MSGSRATLAMAGVALALVLALTPAVQAHTTFETEDGRSRIVVGNLGEPVYTFVKTGLDLCFQANDTARTPLSVDVGAFRATLVSPSGAELEQPLRTQFGRPGCYTFEEGYVLTEPGQYVLHLVGPLNGTTVDARIDVAGPVDDLSAITFPEKGVPSASALDGRIQDLESQQTTMERTFWVALVLGVVIAAVAGAMAGRRPRA